MKMVWRRASLIRRAACSHTVRLSGLRDIESGDNHHQNKGFGYVFRFFGGLTGFDVSKK
jgi:hypothetical protein